MPSLYDAGWRQGSRLSSVLPKDTVVLDSSGIPTWQLEDHDEWVVATQDCDLSFTDDRHAEPTIELHPVFHEHEVSANPNWGIRSRRLLLGTPEEYVVSPSPHTLVAAAVLTAAAQRAGAAGTPLPDIRARAFKTWLGYRYDRPAVPDHLLPLAKRIAHEVERKRHRSTGELVRDVLMQFADDSEPIRFTLVAVLEENADEGLVREWLAEIVRSVPQDLGLGDQILAVTTREISLHFLETSYAADVTQLTWGGTGTAITQ